MNNRTDKINSQDLISDPELEISSSGIELNSDEKKEALVQRALDSRLKNSFRELSLSAEKSRSFDENLFSQRLRNLLDAPYDNVKSNTKEHTKGFSIFHSRTVQIAFASVLIILFSIPIYFYLQDVPKDANETVSSQKLDDNWVGITEELLGANADAWVLGEKDIGSVNWKNIKAPKDSALLASKLPDNQAQSEFPPENVPKTPDDELVASRDFELEDDSKKMENAKNKLANNNKEQEYWKTVNSSKDSKKRKAALLELEKIYIESNNPVKLQNVRNRLKLLK